MSLLIIMRSRLDVRTLLFVVLVIIILIVGAMSYITLTSEASSNVRTDSPKYSDSTTAMVTLYVLPEDGGGDSGT